MRRVSELGQDDRCYATFNEAAATELFEREPNLAIPTLDKGAYLCLWSINDITGYVVSYSEAAVQCAVLSRAHGVAGPSVRT